MQAAEEGIEIIQELFQKEWQIDTQYSFREMGERHMEVFISH